MRALFATDRTSNILFAQRVVLGFVVLMHGLQKALGLFGGYGFTGTMSFFTDTIGLPAAIAFLAIFAETAGSLALIAGFLTRVSAAGIGVVLAGAVVTVHAKVGFFMNWFGNQPGEGVEYFILAFALLVPLLAKGGGRHAVDSMVEDALAASAALSG